VVPFDEERMSASRACGLPTKLSKPTLARVASVRKGRNPSRTVGPDLTNDRRSSHTLAHSPRPPPTPYNQPTK